MCCSARAYTAFLHFRCLAPPPPGGSVAGNRPARTPSPTLRRHQVAETFQIPGRRRRPSPSSAVKAPLGTPTERADRAGRAAGPRGFVLLTPRDDQPVHTHARTHTRSYTHTRPYTHTCHARGSWAHGARVTVRASQAWRIYGAKWGKRGPFLHCHVCLGAWWRGRAGRRPFPRQATASLLHNKSRLLCPALPMALPLPGNASSFRGVAVRSNPVPASRPCRCRARSQ